MELVEEGFTELAHDTSFSQKMRAKFEEAIVESRCCGEERFLLSHLVTDPLADGE